jgi:hypothetical protein
MKNPDAIIFKFNKGQASFAIRKPLENLDNKVLGNGASIWFAIDEEIEKLQASLVEKGAMILGTIMDTPIQIHLELRDFTFEELFRAIVLYVNAKLLTIPGFLIEFVVMIQYFH